MKLTGYRILHVIIMVYLATAFSWWAILLYKKNEETHHLKTELAKLDASMDTTAISASYLTQKRMIYGEGIVFGISILLGLVLINRAFLTELESNKKLNNFLLSVTHELKTPITTLKLTNSTLLRKELSEDQRKSLLQSSHEDCMRLESQINNILAAAQLEQAYAYNYEELNLGDLIETHMSRYERRHPTRPFSFDNRSKATVKIDQESLSKVIDNLLINAIKYSPTDSPIHLSTKDTDKMVEVTITNKGEPISAGDKKRVWEKYYRRGNVETTATQGTGLGLWITKSVVTAHGGKVDVSDAKQGGTTFHFSIPRHK